MSASLLLRYITDLNLPSPQEEHQPGIARKFRLDYAWIDVKIGIEIHGGTYLRGRSGHSSCVGLRRDYEKSNYLQILGWLIIQLDSYMLKNEDYVKEVLIKAFRSRGVEL